MKQCYQTNFKLAIQCHCNTCSRSDITMCI